MSSAQANERTPLTNPSYVFQTSFLPKRALHLRQFQCCLCGLFSVIVIIFFMVLLSYSLDDSNTTPTNNDTNTTNITVDQLATLTLLPVVPLDNGDNIKWITKDGDWNRVEELGRNAIKQREQVEASAVEEDTASYRHQRSIATSAKANELAKAGFAEGYVARQLSKGMHFNASKPARFECDDNHQISKASWFPEALRIRCTGAERRRQCPQSKYRSYNGTCNNMKHPDKWGVGFSPFIRYLPAEYTDGISAPKSDPRLPSARAVSLGVHRSRYRSDNNFTVMLAVWGQFLDHDITATALTRGVNGTAISCCDPTTPRHPECFPVPLTRDDPYWVRYNVTCMEFVRSAPAPSCCLGPRDQMNQVSAYIDGSMVYGPDQATAMALREMRGGLLRMYLTQDNRTLLPMSEDLHDGCNRLEMNVKGRYCFTSGDARANENLHLTTMHLLWARQHNSVAGQLEMLNPHWDDEKLYQEARRIVGAQIQHITYNEFLPILLGQTLMRKYDLEPQQSGYSHGYKDDVDASIENGFAAAAFRFAHTLIPGLVKMLGNDTSSAEYVQLHKMLFDPYRLYVPGELERTVRGAVATSLAPGADHFPNELQQHLFERHGPGLDLVSLNIQRGRDHGLPGYLAFRELCGQPRARSFDELKESFDEESLSGIRDLYAHPENIDPYIGMLSEKPLNGTYLGPTLVCIIADQFRRLKLGDRYWYETSARPQAFTADQLAEVRRTTLASVICSNADSLDSVQPWLMKRADMPGNPTTHCDHIPQPDLSHWRDLVRRVFVDTNDMSVRVRH